MRHMGCQSLSIDRDIPHPGTVHFLYTKVEKYNTRFCVTGLSTILHDINKKVIPNDALNRPNVTSLLVR